MKRKKRLTAIFFACGLLTALEMGLAADMTVSAAEGETSVTSDFHTSMVKIRLQEYMTLEGQRVEWEAPEDVLPGQKISLIPELEGLGEDCYVRVRMTAETESKAEFPKESFQDISDDWIWAGEYLYREEPLKTGEKSEIFQSFEIPADWNHEEMPDDSVQIHIAVDAVQSRNFTPDFHSDAPWGDVQVIEARETGEDYEFRLFERGFGQCRVILEGDQIAAVPEKFFRNLGSIVPGDVMTGEISIENSWPVEEMLYMKLKAEARKDLLEEAKLRIYQDDGEILYDGKLLAESLADYHFIRAYQSGEKGSLFFEIYLPEELDNSYSLEDARMTWVFRAVSERLSENKNNPVKTGDAGHTLLIISAAGAGILALIIGVLRGKGKL